MENQLKRPYKRLISFFLNWNILLIVFIGPIFLSAQNIDYKNPELPINERVNDLLKRMTVSEKIGQMTEPFGWNSWERKGKKIVLTETFKNQISDLNIGAYYGTFRADSWTEVTLEDGLYREEIAQTYNKLQKYNLEHSRLGIPLLFNEDTTHGMMSLGSTVFPVSLAVSSTWNTELAEKMYSVMAREVRATGANWVCSPNLDVVRDPRWGRIEETYGEDPFLCAEMGVASVKGFQGESVDSDHTVATTIKHFVQAIPEGGHNAGFINIGERELREVYLYPFKKAIDAGASSLMAAYADLNGIPCNKNHELLTDIIRNEWGFKGMVLSDAYSVSQLANYHMVSNDLKEASAHVVKAGLDMDMSGDAFQNGLQDAINEGLVTIEEIDQAVSRILKLKFELGLFEHPYVDESRIEEVFNIEEHKQLARTVARESMVLLKNDGNILPLSKNLKSIAVLGPNANNIMNQLGDYTSPQKREWVVSILDGIKQAVSSDTRIFHAKGCDIRNPSKEGFDEALEIANKSELIVAVIGGSSNRLYEPDFVNKNTGQAQIDLKTFNDMDCGEGFDRMDLGLSGVQKELIDTLKKTGKPLVVVLVNGRPLSIPDVVQKADAVLESWYSGAQGGHAVADILFGKYNPSGRLPVSVAHNVGQLPVFYGHRKKERKPYVEMESAPLFPFGFGMSYSTYSYSNMKLSSEAIKKSETVEVTVDIKNEGTMEGAEVVQLYIRDVRASVSRPNMALKGFKKINLKPNQTKTVTFTITPEDLSMYDINMEWVVEPGLFEIMIAHSSNDIRHKMNLEVIKD
jgi:beta-glucosidase